MKARLAILLAGLAFAQAAGAAVFRYASQIDPGTMDPHALASLYHTRVISQIYEPLVGRDEQFKLEPRLAVSWSMVDPHTWRFKLRPGVKFSDGTAFTADDVVFSVLRSIDPKSLQRPTYPNVTGAKKVDELTVDITTSQPTPILPRAFTNSRMMSKKWCIEHHVEKPLDFKSKEETYAARHAMGTGPFMLKSWEPDQKTVLVANPGYWGRHGNVTEAIYLMSPRAPRATPDSSPASSTSWWMRACRTSGGSNPCRASRWRLPKAPAPTSSGSTTRATSSSTPT